MFLADMFVLCSVVLFSLYFFFFFNDTATTEIYTLSLHDALPIWFSIGHDRLELSERAPLDSGCSPTLRRFQRRRHRSEEHTSELQSHHDLVCRLLLEKKKKKQTQNSTRAIKSQ